MRSLVVFESIYGNTRDVAQAVADGLARFGAVRVAEVGESPDPGEYDLIVVGGPIHAWGMPSETSRKGARDEAVAHGATPVSQGAGVREWLAGLARPTRDIAAAAFDTAMHAPLGLHGSAARPEARRLIAAGYRLVAEPEHFFVQGKTGPMLAGEIDRAVAWGASVGHAARARAPQAQSSATSASS